MFHSIGMPLGLFRAMKPWKQHMTTSVALVSKGLWLVTSITGIMYSVSVPMRAIATASADNTARLWDVQTGQELRRLQHTVMVNSIRFSPDGKYVLTGSNDNMARLWDVDYHTTMQYLCSRLLRDFSDDERAQYGITDTTPTCPPAQSSPSTP